MQKDDHLLDQFLKNKVDEVSFDFKEEYWLKASQMLDEEDKKKKRPFYWRWFTVLCVVLAVGVGSFIYSNKNKQQKQDKQAIVSQTEKSEATGNQAPASANTTEKSYNTDKPLVTENAAVAGTELNQITDNSNKPAEKNLTPNNKAHSNIATSGANALNSAGSETVEPNSQKNNQKATDNTFGATVKESVSPKSKRNRKGRQAAIIQNKQQTAAATDNKSIDKAQQNNPVATDQNANIQKTVMLHGRNYQPVDTHSYVSRQPRDESVYNPRYNASLRDYVSERVDSITVYNYIPAPAEKAAEPIAAAPEIRKDTAVKNKNGLKLFVAGGANFNKGFKGNLNTSVAWGVAPYLNAGAEKKINSKISMAAQIGFTYFNAMNVQKKVVHYKYSFGYDSTQLSVTYQRMYQLILPVSAMYHLNKFHTVLASLGASYVMNTASKVTDNGSNSNQTGYQDGINPFDMFAQLGYQYSLDRRFALQAFLQQGFMSATKKEYFNINTNNTQTRVSLGLKYYFKRNGN